MLVDTAGVALAAQRAFSARQRVCCAVVPSAAAETEIAYTPSPYERGGVFDIVNVAATAPK